MYDATREGNLEAEYKAILDQATAGNADRKFIRMSERYAEGHWRRFITKLKWFKSNLDDKVFLDFGSKFGHLTPLIRSQGATKIYSVDVDPIHIDQGSKFIAPLYGSEYSFSDEGYIEIPSDSVDLILVNEVISHVNPMYLDRLYSECSRVLKVGGEIVISDGNNLSHEQTWTDLVEWYELWEHGSSKEFGDGNYLKRRQGEVARLAGSRLSESEVEYVALNTSGMFGERLHKTVAQYVRTRSLIERPYQPGISPTHPELGVMMERGFFPAQVELALKTYGIDAVQLKGSHPVKSELDRGWSKNFTIRGRKIEPTVETLKAFVGRSLFEMRAPEPDRNERLKEGQDRPGAPKPSVDDRNLEAADESSAISQSAVTTPDGNTVEK